MKIILLLLLTSCTLSKPSNPSSLIPTEKLQDKFNYLKEQGEFYDPSDGDGIIYRAVRIYVDQDKSWNEY